MLQLDGLTRRFGDVVALAGLSFAVEPGQMFGFVGANGAGKTTAMRIIVGIDTPEQGTVRWKGHPVDEAQRLRFGYMPEERGLYPKMSPARQLVYLAQLHDVDRAEARRRANVWLDRLGLGERADEPVERLSQGNQQRIQLAAALVHEPDLLVLDEPFNGLDPVGVDVLAEILLERVAAGVAVIFSSHQLDLVEQLCDAVAIIDAGRLVAHGSVEELRDRGRPVLYRVAVEGGNDTWFEGVEGADVRARDDGSVIFELTGTDSAALLDAARAAGRVTHFARVVPRLTELYREVVGAPSRIVTRRGAVR